MEIRQNIVKQLIGQKNRSQGKLENTYRQMKWEDYLPKCTEFSENSVQREMCTYQCLH